MTDKQRDDSSFNEVSEDWDLSWQAADVEQKVLENARQLWQRSVQQNIRDAVGIKAKIATSLFSCRGHRTDKLPALGFHKFTHSEQG